MKKSNSTKLTDLQEMFCQEYCIDFNATAAAIRAGYKEKTAAVQGSRLLKKDNILSRVRAIQSERLKKLALTQDTVLINLMEVYNRCMKTEPVREWNYELHEYVETGEFVFDAKGALKAMELIGKHLAMFDKKLNDSAENENKTGIILLPDIKKLEKDNK